MRGGAPEEVAPAPIRGVHVGSGIHEVGLAERAALKAKEVRVFVDGALWHARRGWGDDEHGELHAGDRVVVEQLNGLTLRVRAAEEWELAP